jgi:hypothetical protein
MTALRIFRTAVGPEYLIVTTSGRDTTPGPRAIRAAVGFEYLIAAEERVTR